MYERTSMAVVALIAIAVLDVGCMSMVYKREPKIPRRERNPHVSTPPVIDLTFECAASDTAAYSPAQFAEGRCSKEREAFDKVAGELEFLANASEDATGPSYRLVIRVDWVEDYKLASMNQEVCGVMWWVLLPCTTRARLSASATLFGPDGEAVAQGEAHATRTMFTHVGMVLAWPVGIPWWGSAIRFSTNTYRDLLAQIGKAVAERD